MATRRKTRVEPSTQQKLKVSAPVSSLWDEVFRAVGVPDIPPSYLWALAKNESSLNPDATGPSGEIGLMQIAKSTLASYNADNPKEPIPTEIEARKVANNVKVAGWLIRRILKSFSTYHPVTLKTDWNSDRFVALVTQAYNAGESETAGVGRAVKLLEGRGVKPEGITYLATAKIAKEIGFNKWMPEPGRLAYISRVVNDYRRKLASSSATV